MQLSLPLPLPTIPDPAMPGLAPLTPALPCLDPAVVPAAAFEQFLPKAGQPDKGATSEAETADVGKMSAILGAAFWMPAVPPPQAPVPVAAAVATGSVANAPVLAAVSAPAGPGIGGLVRSGPTVQLTDGILPQSAKPDAGSVAVFPTAAVGAREKNCAPASVVATPVLEGSPVVPAGDLPEEPVTQVAGPTQPMGLLPPDSRSAAAPAPQGNQGATGLPSPETSVLAASTTAAVGVATSVKRPGPSMRGIAESAGKSEIAETKSDQMAAATSDSDISGAAPQKTDVRPPAVGAASGWEKSAAALLYAPDNVQGRNISKEKDFLTTVHSLLTNSSSGIGTGVAKVSPVMPAVLPNRSKSDAGTETALQAVAQTGKLPALDFSVSAPAPTATVRETMAAVVSAVDAMERGVNAGRASVDLQFRVGEEHLALRVELRDGTVHTTFRTDSTELRTALSQQWQSVVPSATGGHELRLADPVFSSSPSGGAESSFTSTGQGMPQPRQHGAPETSAAFRTGDVADLLAPEAATATAPATQRLESLLHAFA